MYEVYLDNMMLPVAPSKVQTKIKNQNKTLNLMDSSEINVIKAAGLTEISFDALIPMHRYPFANYTEANIKGKKENEFVRANYYLDYLEYLKIEQKSFYFKITRLNHHFHTQMLVTLEEYTIEEEASNGNDIMVSIKLKQYLEYGTKVEPLESSKNNGKKDRKTSKDLSKSQFYTVKKGESLWLICKKLLGDGSKCWNVARLNGLKNPNLIRVGQKLKIQDVKAGSARSAGYSTTKKSSFSKGISRYTSISGTKGYSHTSNGGISPGGHSHSGGGRSFPPSGGISPGGHSHSGGDRAF